MQLLAKFYNNIKLSVIPANNKVGEHDINSQSQIRLSEKFTILIEGQPEETGVMVKKLQDFMQSSLYYPMLIRDFSLIKSKNIKI